LPNQAALYLLRTKKVKAQNMEKIWTVWYEDGRISYGYLQWKNGGVVFIPSSKETVELIAGEYYLGIKIVN